MSNTLDVYGCSISIRTSATNLTDAWAELVNKLDKAGVVVIYGDMVDFNVEDE